MNPATTRPRNGSIDALRGLAVLGMSFSGMVAAKGLPAWMYHAQHDPTVFGITWVDLVFPFFIFSMGAAIAFVVESRIAAGATLPTLAKGFFWRALALGGFAILGEHWRPYSMSPSPGPLVWLLSLLGFVALGLMFLRWPESVPRTTRIALTALGWVGSIVVLAFVRYPDGVRGLANFRNDPILMSLANVSFSGGLIYYFTRGKLLARVAVMAAVALMLLTAGSPGLGKTIWDFAPTNWLHLDRVPWGRFVPVFYHFEYHKYLLVALPGTICGEILVRRGASKVAEGTARAAWVGGFGAFALCGVVTAGLLARQSHWTALAAIVVLVAVKWAFDRCDRGGVATDLFWWGVALLGLGLLAEPLGGGIRKDGPTTLSYPLVSSGLAFVTVAGLGLWIDGLKRAEWRPIIDVGTNPILGYVVITNVITALSGLTHVEDVYANDALDPWLITFVGALKTVAVGACVVWATRRHVFWRA